MSCSAPSVSSGGGRRTTRCSLARQDMEIMAIICQHIFRWQVWDEQFYTWKKQMPIIAAFSIFSFPWFWKFQSLKFSDLRKMFLCSQAGVGKTSIALGLAQLIAEGKVPLNLQVWKHSTGKDLCFGNFWLSGWNSCKKVTSQTRSKDKKVSSSVWLQLCWIFENRIVVSSRSFSWTWLFFWPARAIGVTLRQITDLKKFSWSNKAN